MPPDPLAGLRGLHVPQAGLSRESSVLLAAALGLAAAVLLQLALAAWRRRARRRRAALAALAATRLLPSPERIAAQAALLRGLVAGEAERAGESRGEAWLARLDAAFSTDFFRTGPGRAYGDALYRPDGEPDAAGLDAGLVELIGRRRPH